MPLVMLKGSVVYDSKLREAVWPMRNEWVQSQMLGGKPMLHKVWVVCARLMLSKNPEMSKRRALVVPIAHVT
jgi:hypothetical protein